MKISAVVTEYNPFHNGHKYQLDKIRELTGCDALVVIMSGSFTQRGEIAITDKYSRARHAILGGADIVFELPTVFSTANAETFALGAVKLLSSLNGDVTLCFGCESGEKEEFSSTASVLLDESKEFKALLSQELANGIPFAKARTNALEKMNIDGINLDLLSSPNNILGIEYVKAIISLGANMDFLPIKRKGSAYGEQKLQKNFSSATAIRKAIADGNYKKVKGNVPKFVYKDLPTVLPCPDQAIILSAIKKTTKEIQTVPDCTEGLEHRIKAMAKDVKTLDEFLDKLKTKRYTMPRLQRILIANLLDIEKKFIDKCLSNKLYLKVLAIASDEISLLANLVGEDTLSFITRKTDTKKLSSVALDCFEKDVEANDVFGLISGKFTNEYDMKIVERE